MLTQEQAEADAKKKREDEIAAFDKIENGLLPQKHDVFRPLNGMWGWIAQ